MSALWTSAELRAATGGRLEAEVAVARVGFDSRQVEAGDLFVALKAAREAALAFPRQALHAATLGFRHPVTGEALRFSAEPPADMALLLECLRT